MALEREFASLEEDHEPAIESVGRADEQGLVAYYSALGNGRVAYRQEVADTCVLKRDEFAVRYDSSDFCLREVGFQQTLYDVLLVV